MNWLDLFDVLIISASIIFCSAVAMGGLFSLVVLGWMIYTDCKKESNHEEQK